MTAFLSRRGLLGLALAAGLGLLHRRGADRSPPQPAKPIGNPPATPAFHGRLAHIHDDGAGTTTCTYQRWPGAAPVGQPLETMAYGTPLGVTSVDPSRTWPDPSREPGPARSDADPGAKPQAEGPHPGGAGEPGGDH